MDHLPNPTEPSADHDHADGMLHRMRHFLGHNHDRGPALGTLSTNSAEGIRATKLSLIGLGATAALQAVVVLFSGSVALLSDTVHNLADALTAIPLWIAFSLACRTPTRRYTHGFHRAEDAAGLLIVMAIAGSAVFIVWESLRRLIEPRLMDHIPWVIAAGVVGAAGNELVARYRIRVGRSINSEALVADGQHARADAFTSLAVVAAGVGAALDVRWVDPAAGLMVGVFILRLLYRSGRSILRRLLDGVEPGLVDRAEAVASSVDGVRRVDDLRVRWQGHLLHVSVAVVVDSMLTVAEGHEIASAVEHELHHAFDCPVTTLIHVDPDSLLDPHGGIAHHRH